MGSVFMNRKNSRRNNAQPSNRSGAYRRSEETTTGTEMPSPTNEVACSNDTRFVYNPYSSKQAFDVVSSSSTSSTTSDAHNREVAKKVLPLGTQRLDLFNAVSFIPFPDYVSDRSRQRTEAPPVEDRPDYLVQLFFGQLPYKASDKMMLWLCQTIANADILYIERVMQDKSRKGCMQVFFNEADIERVTTSLNKRVLFEATGIWHARTTAEVAALEAHCSNTSNRFHGLPFRMLVAEKSTSTYVRRHRQPAPASVLPSRTATPPPSQDDFDEVTVPSIDGGDDVYDMSPVGEIVEPPMTDCCGHVCTCPMCVAPVHPYHHPQYYYYAPEPVYMPSGPYCSGPCCDPAAFTPPPFIAADPYYAYIPRHIDGPYDVPHHPYASGPHDDDYYFQE